MNDLTANEIDALLDALRAPAETADTGDARTATEIAEQMGCGIGRARKRIGQAMKEGRVRCVQVWRTRIDGQVQKVPAYRIS